MFGILIFIYYYFSISIVRKIRQRNVKLCYESNLLRSSVRSYDSFGIFVHTNSIWNLFELYYHFAPPKVRFKNFYLLKPMGNLPGIRTRGSVWMKIPNESSRGPKHSSVINLRILVKGILFLIFAVGISSVC